MKHFAATLLLLASASFSLATPVKRAVNNANGANIDTVILQYALTLEHLENAYYTQSLKKYDAEAFAAAGYPAGVRQRFLEIAHDEQVHVDLLTKAIGSNATAPCTYNFSSVTDPKSFAALSAILESVGVSAYLGAAANITDAAYLSVAAAILTVEARHQSWVSGAVNSGNPYPSSFDTPLSSFSTVYSLAAQFITECPSSNPALPAIKFPTLAISPATATAGDTITLTFNSTGNVGQEVFAAFFNGLSPTFVSISSDNTVKVPTTIQGTTYIVVTSSKTELTDANAIAGVGLLNGPAGA